MAPPSAVETVSLPHQPLKVSNGPNSQLGKEASSSKITLQSNLQSSQIRHVTPLKQTGVLDQYESFEVTPVIGREFRNVDLVQWMQAENSDALIRDLAITIAERGVVFFRAQDNLTNELQKQLVLRLGQLSGRPETSGLHIHPFLNPQRGAKGGDDLEISTISSVQQQNFYNRKSYAQQAASGAKWHSDIAFEKVPADFSSLRLTKLPSSGGDTLWASGYEIYDRISPPIQRLLESLSVTFDQPEFAKAAERLGQELYTKPRGAVENVGPELRAQHPVIRTNPVTGWKSVYPIGGHVSHIDDVSEDESKWILDHLLAQLHRNDDTKVRFKWLNPNDIAIWDNRSAFHTAILDYDGLGERFGNRAVGVGEVPFYDPDSKSRREDLGLFLHNV